MKYKKQLFDSAVEYYEKKLTGVKGKLLFIEVSLQHKDSFLAMAPLSRAVHNKGGDIHVVVTDSKKSSNVALVERIWEKPNHPSIKQFIKTVVAKTKDKSLTYTRCARCNGWRKLEPQELSKIARRKP